MDAYEASASAAVMSASTAPDTASTLSTTATSFARSTYEPCRLCRRAHVQLLSNF